MEQLDLLLLTVAKARKIHADGVRFQGMRYIDPTLAAYVGESVVLRYDPRDMAEVRLFHRGKFLCRAICPELAGQTVALRDIRLAREQRRRDLRTTLRERRETVESGGLCEVAGARVGRHEWRPHISRIERCRRSMHAARGVSDEMLDGQVRLGGTFRHIWPLWKYRNFSSQQLQRLIPISSQSILFASLFRSRWDA